MKYDKWIDNDMPTYQADVPQCFPYQQHRKHVSLGRSRLTESENSSEIKQFITIHVCM